MTHPFSKYFTSITQLTKFIIVLLILQSSGVEKISAQFEPKLSINLSGGIFKTVGDKHRASPADDIFNYTPFLMPHFEAGFSLTGGLQYNFNRNFSLEGDAGFLHSSYWHFQNYGSGVSSSHLGWSIREPETDDFIAGGSNYFALDVLHFGLEGKYYFLPSKKLNPYAYLGLNLNQISIEYFDLEYERLVSLGRNDELTEDGSRMWLDEYFAPGIILGGGVEYPLNDQLGFFLQADWHLSWIEEEDLFEKVAISNMNVLRIELGARVSFLKSKEY